MPQELILGLQINYHEKANSQIQTTLIMRIDCIDNIKILETPKCPPYELDAVLHGH